ncbi:OPT oligopeptide transporter protein-domain-containing protein [Zopfochytrium polystomum]|nr:OPT oligopeptide transporter protein-domain-containing protein [Zopfochytrium polystomum]
MTGETTILTGRRAGSVLSVEERLLKGGSLTPDEEVALQPKSQDKGDDHHTDNILMDDIYESLDAVVPTTDDPRIPVLTVRVWALGTFFAVMLSAVNTLFTFRSNTFFVNPFIGVLLSYPLGHMMAFSLPTRSFYLFGKYEFSFNPGPFSLKEHALIYVYASTASGPAYALYNLIGQKYQLYQSNLHPMACLTFGIVTQCFGYGLAGLCRRYLVKPAAMLWPSNLSTIALLNSLHQRDDNRGQISRYKFFWLATLCMGIYQLFPSYIAPILSAVSVLCYFAPVSKDPQLTRMLGSAQPGGGIGLLSLTFDWSIISAHSPITTPLWALMNQFFGIWLFLWIIVPILWRNNAFSNDMLMGTDPRDGPNGTRRFPLGQTLNSPQLFFPNGTRVAARDFVNTTSLTLNEAFYNENKPVHITTYFAIEYFTSFVVFAATIVHVYLWYGKDIWKRFTTAMKDLDRDDIHSKLMEAYDDVPDWWYMVLLGVNIIVGIVVCQWGGFDLPFWGVFLALLLAMVSIIPIGTIQAISGQQVGLNVMSEFLIGLILPGRIAAVMSFKTLSYMSMHQGLFLVQDLKLGHYVKIPPRAMFTVQLVSTILAVTINVFTAFGIYESFGRSETEYIDPNRKELGFVWNLQSADPPKGWNANNYVVFLNAGAIWGAIGPARFFGSESPYSSTLFGFLVGAVLPTIFWGLHKIFPTNKWFHLVNIPLIAVFPMQAGGFRSDLLSPVIVGFAVNFFIKNYSYAWWKRYAYVMSAAFDSGSAIGLTVTFLLFSVNSGFQIPFPNYALNRADVELCAPEYYQTCVEHMIQGNAFGKTYKLEDDEYCKGIGFGGQAKI